MLFDDCLWCARVSYDNFSNTYVIKNNITMMLISWGFGTVNKGGGYYIHNQITRQCNTWVEKERMIFS